MKLPFIYQLTKWKKSVIHVTKFTCDLLFEIMTMNHTTCYQDMHRNGGVLNRPFPSHGAAKKCKASVGRQMTIENSFSNDFFHVRQ